LTSHGFSKTRITPGHSRGLGDKAKARPFDRASQYQYDKLSGLPATGGSRPG
jgi:hypothetical protein